VIVGPGKIVTGANVTGWESYTPSTQGFGSPTAVLEYKRSGDSIIIRGRVTTGTCTGDEAQIGLPSSLTVGGPSSTSTVVAGRGNRSISVAGSRALTILVTEGDTFINFGRQRSDVTSNPTSPSIANGAFGNAEKFTFTTDEIPIAEWAGSGTSNLGANDVEYYSYEDSSATTANTNYSDQTKVLRSPRGAQFAAIATSAANTETRYDITVPALQETDTYDLQLNQNNGGWVSFKGDPSFSAYTRNDNTIYGMSIHATSTTNIRISFGNAGRRNIGAFDATGSAWSDIDALDAFRWRIIVARAGIAVGFSAATADQAGLVSGEDNIAEGDIGTVSWNGTAPAGTVSKKFKCIQTGKTVDFWARATYTTAGTANLRAFFDLPSACPTPASMSNATLGGSSEVLSSGSGFLLNVIAQHSNTGDQTFLEWSGGAYRIFIHGPSQTAEGFVANVKYWID
jgi:hypothetical protein